MTGWEEPASASDSSVREEQLGEGRHRGVKPLQNKAKTLWEATPRGTGNPGAAWERLLSASSHI